MLQPQNGYRAGLDAVLLAAAAPATPGIRVLDVGAGVGVVGLAVARRIADAHVTLVERDPLLAASPAPTSTATGCPTASA